MCNPSLSTEMCAGNICLPKRRMKVLCTHVGGITETCADRIPYNS